MTSLKSLLPILGWAPAYTKTEAQSDLVAAVLAKGKTELSGVHYIERGYDRIVEKFKALGTPISVVDG